MKNLSLSHTQSVERDPQRVFKVVFLGNSGVGKSSFIQHYSSGHFPHNMASTVGETLLFTCDPSVSRHDPSVTSHV